MRNDMGKNIKSRIRGKQNRLNSLLSLDQSTSKLVSKEILKLSCEIDELIVKYYSRKQSKAINR